MVSIEVKCISERHRASCPIWQSNNVAEDFRNLFYISGIFKFGVVSRHISDGSTYVVVVETPTRTTGAANTNSDRVGRWRLRS